MTIFAISQSSFNGKAHNDELNDTLDTERNIRLSTKIYNTAIANVLL